MSQSLLSRNDRLFLKEQVGRLVDSLDAIGKEVRENRSELKKIRKELEDQ